MAASLLQPGCALSDFIEECRREEAKRGGRVSSPDTATRVAGKLLAAAGDDGLAESTRAVEALVDLVRREVRAAVEAELSNAWHSRDFRDFSTAPCDSKSCAHSDRATISTVSPSSCEGSPRGRQHGAVSGQQKSPSSLLHDPDGMAATVMASAAQQQLLEQRCTLAGLQETLLLQKRSWEQTWRTEAELRVGGDQDVEERLTKRLEGRLDSVEEKLTKIHTTLGSFVKFQAEIGSEAEQRRERDTIIQAFLHEFRDHIGRMLDEMWAQQKQMGANVESVHSFIAKALGVQEGQCQALFAPVHSSRSYRNSCPAPPGPVHRRVAAPASSSEAEVSQLSLRLPTPRLASSSDEPEVSFSGDMVMVAEAMGCSGCRCSREPESTPSSTHCKSFGR